MVGQVLFGLSVTTQLVAVVTQMVMSFDKANSAFRDRQQEYIRFASSRSLPAEVRANGTAPGSDD